MAGIPTACIVEDDAGGWESDAAEGAEELFGHDLETLGVLAAGGIEARFVELQRE